MDIFMQEAFALKSAFNFNQATARVLQKGLQMQQYKMQKFAFNSPPILSVQPYIMDTVIEENSPETVGILV